MLLPKIHDRFPFLPSETSYGELHGHKSDVVALYRSFATSNQIEDIACERERRAIALMRGIDVWDAGNASDLSGFFEALKTVDASTALALADMETPDKEIVDRIDILAKKSRSKIWNTLNVSRNGVVSNDPECERSSDLVKLCDITDIDRCMRRWHALRMHPSAAGFHSFDTQNRSLHAAIDIYRQLSLAKQHLNIYSGDADRLMEACIMLTTCPDANVVVTVGFGGSDTETTARAPAYLDAGVRMMKTFHTLRQQGVIVARPRLRILNASNLAATLNDRMDADSVRLRGYERMNFLYAFIERFVPDLLEYTVFENDEDYVIPEEDLASDAFDRLSLPDWYRSQVHARVSEMVNKGRMSEGVALNRARQYLYAHGSLFMDWQERSHDHFGRLDACVSIGGHGEKFFNVFREIFLKWLHNYETRHHYPVSTRIIGRAGYHPPYYTTAGDFCLSELDGSTMTKRAMELPQNGSINKELRSSLLHDYNAIFIAVAEAEGLPVDTEGIARAESIYRAWCKEYVASHATCSQFTS